MNSRLNRFILISLLIHLLILMLFSFQETKPLAPSPIVVDLKFSNSRSSSSLSKSAAKKSSSQSANNQDTRARSFRDAASKQSSTVPQKSTSTTVKQSTTSSGKKSTTPTLIRNTAPSATRSFRDASNDESEVESVSRQLTLEKSDQLIRGSRSTSQNPDQGNAAPQGQSGDIGFGEEEVFEKSSVSGGGGSSGGGKSFNLNSSSSGQGGGSSGSTGDTGSSGFNWKDSGQRVLVSKNELVFPPSLVGKGVDEEVIVGFKVALDGKVYEIELIKSSGYSELDNAVKDQVRSFRFNSAPGNKVSEAEYSYLFRLEK